MKARTTLRSITPPPSVISASVIPNSRADDGPLADALISLARTDPSIRVTEDEQEAQTLVHGLGALHLEIVEGRLRDEWRVSCTFGKRRVSYRETWSDLGPHTHTEHWQRDMGGKKIGASVSLTVRSLTSHETPDEEWGGNLVLHTTVPLRPIIPESSQDDALLYVAQGLLSSLTSSPHSSLSVAGLHITVDACLLDGSSPPSVAASAASVALRRALQQIGPGVLMEPYMSVIVHTAEEHVGKIVKDFNERGGEVQDLTAGASTDADEAFSAEGMYVPPALLTPSAMPLMGKAPTVRMKRTVQAMAPLSRMLDYSSRLRALSAGQATFEMQAHGFRSVNEPRQLEILEEIGR